MKNTINHIEIKANPKMNKFILTLQERNRKNKEDLQSRFDNGEFDKYFNK